jgi:hypothetical protein
MTNSVNTHLVSYIAVDINIKKEFDICKHILPPALDGCDYIRQLFSMLKFVKQVGSRRMLVVPTVFHNLQFNLYITTNPIKIGWTDMTCIKTPDFGTQLPKSEEEMYNKWSLFNTDIVEGDEGDVVTDSNVFNLEGNRNYLETLKLKIGEKSFKNLDIVMAVRLAVLNSLGISQSNITDKAMFRVPESSYDSVKHSHMIYRELIYHIIAEFKPYKYVSSITLRALQGKKNISIYRKYGYVHIDDPLPDTPEFKEHMSDLQELQSFSVREHINDLRESHDLRSMNSIRATGDSVSMAVFIERVNEMIFFTRGKFTQDSTMCEFLTQEYIRNPFMYLIMMHHTYKGTKFTALIDAAIHYEKYLIKSDVSNNPIL